MRIPFKPAIFALLSYAAATGAAQAVFIPKDFDVRQFQWEQQRATGKRIDSVAIENEKTFPDVLRQKLQALRGTSFSMSRVREIVLWYGEAVGDSRIELAVEESGGSIDLRVRLKQRPKINKIVFTGLGSFSQPVLEALLDFKVGDELDPGLLEVSLQKVANYFAAHGHLGAVIQADFVEGGSLLFKVEEGSVTRINGISVSEIDSVENKDYRRRMQQSLLDSFGVKKGDKLDKENIDTGLVNVRSWLHGRDFLLAKEPQLEVMRRPDGTADIKLNIQYGPRIRFGFRDNEKFSHRELMTIIDEVKEVSIGSDYLEAIRRKITDAYKEVGMVNVQVNTIVRDDTDKGLRHISLAIDEGDKVRISRINLEGIFAFDQEHAMDLFQSFASRLVQRNYYHESGIRNAGELLADHLRSLGYLSAKLEYARTEFSQDRKSTVVTLLFNEGPQTILEELALTGVGNIQIDEAKALFDLKPGQPFNIFAFEKGLQAIKDRYQDIGFLTMRIENEGTDSIVQYSRDHTKARLNVIVDEGPQIRVGEIIVRGNPKTHTRVVTRELPFISGDVLTRPLLRETEDNLRRLNLFGSVIVRPIEHPSAENVRDILILVEETEPGILEFAPGYRNDLGLRAGLGVSYQNLGGWHRGVSARAILNRRLEDYRFIEYNLSMGFREPYFLNWPVTMTSGLNFIRRIYSSFDAKISKFTQTMTRNFTTTLTGFIEYSFERLTIDNIRNPLYSQAEDGGTKNIGAITPGFIWDTRDNRFNPTAGVLSTNRLEIATAFLGSKDRGGDLGYYRANTSNSIYQSVLGDVVIAGSVNYGFERSNVRDQPIPLTKLFRLGGLGSIRGYRDDIIEVETQSVINGTLALINYRGELRVPLSGAIGSALFIDAGNLNIDSFRPFSRLRASAGAGLRYNTPVGPVVLDVAWKLQYARNKLLNRDEDRYRIHFAIGTF